jgi:hypothetical protein
LFAAAFAILILLFVTPQNVPSPPSDAWLNAAVSTSVQGTRGATFDVETPSLAEGTQAQFVLRLTATDCAPNAPPDEAVARIVLEFGDGFAFQMPGLVNQSSCEELPGNETISLSYAYHEVGRFFATANVTWADGYAVAPPPVVVNVTAASNSLTLSALEALAGGAAVTTLMLGLIFWLRRVLPPPPQLPASET